MILTTSYKSNQFLWLGLKVLIAFACLYFIVTRITENNDIDFSQFWSFLTDFDLFSVKNLFILAFLSCFNWFLEIYKWRILTREIRKISWLEATEQCLSALSFSLLTPNRLGEYGAKTYFFPREHWKKIVVLNGIGNGYQLLSTLVFGCLGIGIFWNQLYSIISQSTRYSLLVLALLPLVLFSVGWCRKQLGKLLRSCKGVGAEAHTKVLVLSMLRYLVFSHQFACIVWLFAPSLSYPETLGAITLVYLISSIVPMLSLFDVVLKGSVALFVFSWLNLTDVYMVSTVLLMWVLNFAFPALTGTYFILRLRLPWNS